MKSRNGNTTPPVKEGEELESKCISIGKKGDGIFKFENFVIIAPKTEVGKTYKLKIKKVLSSISFAEVVNQEEEGEVEDTVKDTENFGTE